MIQNTQEMDLIVPEQEVDKQQLNIILAELQKNTSEFLSMWESIKNENKRLRKELRIFMVITAIETLILVGILVTSIILL